MLLTACPRTDPYQSQEASHMYHAQKLVSSKRDLQNGKPSKQGLHLHKAFLKKTTYNFRDKFNFIL